MKKINVTTNTLIGSSQTLSDWLRNSDTLKKLTLQRTLTVKLFMLIFDQSKGTEANDGKVRFTNSLRTCKRALLRNF